MILCIYIYTYVTYVYVSLYVQNLCADIIPTRTHRATYLFVQVLPVSCGGVSKKRQRSADQQRDTLAKPSSLKRTRNGYVLARWNLTKMDVSDSCEIFWPPLTLSFKTLNMIGQKLLLMGLNRMSDVREETSIGSNPLPKPFPSHAAPVGTSENDPFKFSATKCESEGTWNGK